MATKRSGEGGSNIGLIVTLVFFVLLSVIVSVLAYMGFDGQEELKKAKAKAEGDAKTAEKRMRWYRFQAHLYRSYMGHPVEKDALTQLKDQKKSLDSSGSHPDAEDGEDKTTLEKLVVGKDAPFNREMPWDPERSDAPDQTFETRLRAKDRLLADARKAADDAALARVAAEDARKDAEKDKAKETDLKTTFQNNNARDRDDYQKWATAVDGRIDANFTNVKTLGDVRAQKQAVEDEKKKLEGRIRTLQARVDQSTKDLKSARDEIDDARARLAAVADKAGIDTRAMTAELMDAKAQQLIKNWDRNWQIVAMDRKGTMPYINLGTRDGLTTQVTFSVHSVGPDGKLNPTPKGTVEVIRVFGAKQSQVRVTSVKDAKADPLLKGDRLFNPTWDPSRKKRIAIAGLADLGGDGTDNTEDLRRLLTRQAIIIDAYIDTKDEKSPKIEGVKKAVDQNTDYLILADSLDGVNHPKSRETRYNKEFLDLMKKLKDQATQNGVTVIPLRRYLDLIGYRAPRSAGAAEK